jgi:hypothetical protein
MRLMWDGFLGKGVTWGCCQGCDAAGVGTVDDVSRDFGDDGKEWLLRLDVALDAGGK